MMKILSEYAKTFNFTPYLDRTFRNGSGGRNTIPSFCSGTAFSYKDFEVKLDINKPQWSANCGLVVHKMGQHPRGSCEYCELIKAHNLRRIQGYYDQIKDFSKIEFDPDGVINLNKAIRGDEKKQAEDSSTKDIAPKKKDLSYDMVHYLDEINKQVNANKTMYKMDMAKKHSLWDIRIDPEDIAYA